MNRKMEELELRIFSQADSREIATTLGEGRYLAGRGEACAIRLRHFAVSERHAVLLFGGGALSVEDLGSSNGTYLNGELLEPGRPYRVFPGGEIVIGPYRLSFGGLPPKEEPQKAATAQPLPAAVSDASSAQPLSQSDGALELRRSIKDQIHRELVQRLDLKRMSASRASGEELGQKASEILRSIVSEVSSKLPKGIDPAALAREIYNEALKLGPLEDFLADDSISEIMINGPRKVFVERRGRIELTDQSFMDDESVLSVIDRIVSPLGRRIDESQPYVDARLKDGSRVNAVIPPLALNGPCVTIRKFSKVPLTVEDFVRFGTWTREMAFFLSVCVKMRKNIIVSGGTGSGKTTLLNLLGTFIPPQERIITIEDAAELRLEQPHLVRLESRPPNIEGRGAVTIRDLVRNALRMRPDRIIVGECRGGETLDMLQAMNTGHDGSLTTVHANSPRDVVSRLETMVLMSGLELPSRAIREQIASAVDLIVHESRFSDGSRRITHVTEVTGLEGSQTVMQDLFVYRQTGVSESGKVEGYLSPTGSMPTFYGQIKEMGLALDPSIFSPEGAAR